MFISRLEMSGFKSFASRTTIDFRAGVMAVVGPNGCGKTNIVDAVRWVLGEQRTSTLRAERMEAVIFNGTAKRRPVGMAEVMLTIENDKGVLPSPYTQVELSRRLSRSGDSEYLINRAPSRLRDVQDLFADTGFGHSAYSIIELAMVEGIINGPSESRRSLFEEAAGVAKFKSRRTAAERRLEQTKESLDRLKDVYGEVEKNYHALKRQSGKAKRYQSLTRALQLRLLADLARERIGIISRRSPTEERLKIIVAEMSGLETAITMQTAESLRLEAEDLTLEGKLARGMETLKRVERREAELEGELALVRQREAHVAAELAGADQQRAALKEAIERGSKVEQETGLEIEALTAQLGTAEAEKTRLEEESKQLGETSQAARRALEGLRARETELERTISNQQETLRRNQSEREQLAGSLATAKRRLEELAGKNADLVERQKGLRGAVGAGEKAVVDGRTVREKLAAELEIARRSLSEAHSDSARKGAELAAARGALAAHKAREGSLAGLPKALKRLAQTEKLTLLAERIECRPEYHAAVVAALRSLLDAIDRPSLSELLTLGGEFAKGEAAVMRASGGSRKATGKLGKSVEGSVAGADLIENSGEFGDFLRGRLSDVLLVSNRGDLEKLASWAAENSIRLVTPQGELLEPDGVLHAGVIDPQAFRVGWTKRLKELESAATEAETLHKSAEEALKAREKELQATEARLATVRKDLQKAEDEFAAAQRSLAGVQSDLAQIESRRKESAAEESRLKTQLDALPEVNVADTSSNDSLASDLKSLHESRLLAEREVQALEARLLQAGDARASISAEAARAVERLASAKERRDAAVREIASAGQRLAELEARLATAGGESKMSTQAREGIEAQLDLVRKEKADLTTTHDETKNKRQEVLFAKQATATSLKGAQDSQKRLSGEQSHLETEAVTFRERLREIDRRLLEDAGANPEQISDRTPELAEVEIQDLGLAELSHDQIKVRIQSLGPVNMLALEELEQVEERYRFLTDQRKDLEGGIELLTETIDRINHEARRRFRETFDQVDKNFQGLFRTLFEGGEARITLEGGDPLEADIRIWATPTGKKLQGLAMLSGGEKTLTAISLLFAIYLVRPSPFCILDEVDAPLDDANIGRFNRMIRDFSKDTQFLIVTHNKRTMEAADSLIGVTLADDGASQLVSVRLESNGTAEPTGRTDAAIG